MLHLSSTKRWTAESSTTSVVDPQVLRAQPDKLAKLAHKVQQEPLLTQERLEQLVHKAKLAHKVHKVSQEVLPILVLQAHKEVLDLKVPRVYKALPAQLALRALKVLKEHKVYKALLAPLVPKVRKVPKVPRVMWVPRVHKV